jgi:uncharacterized protein (DUF2235 family)
MKRRLILCLDGTWNTYGDHTNVARLHAIVPNVPDGADGADGNVAQIKYYDEGVGTGQFDRLRGGALGLGLGKNIRQAYAWLIENYQQDDELFIFGFSRGAYTARSLAGLISSCGIAYRSRVSGKRDAESLAKHAYSLYRPSNLRVDEAKHQAARFRADEAHSARIFFLGVWDTVGALGVPSLKFAERFHNTGLSDKVDHAYHAMAIDEHRKAYDVVLWRENPGNAKMEQRWFSGAHANIGGGYEDDLLPDLSFKWMLQKACACGLYLGKRRDDTLITLDDVLPLDRSEFRSPVRDSYREFLFGVAALNPFNQRHFRTIGASINESVDDSVFRKIEHDPTYRPRNLAHAGTNVALPGAGF